MRLSKRTEYGLRAAMRLARLWPTHLIQSKDLSAQEALPNKFLEAILLALRRGGFLESKVGSGGGYRLSRAPKDINVGDLVRRLEGRLTVNETCDRSTQAPGEITVRLINERLTRAMDGVLDELTLADLVELVNQETGANQQMYYI